MARTPAHGETQQLGIRVPVTLIERLDLHVERMRARAPGITITRTDAIRHLLEVGLAAAEAAEQAEGGKRKK